MRIDAHQHFWRYLPEDYPPMHLEPPIQRDFLPGDIAPTLNACGLDGCIAVEARRTLTETRWLLELADSSPGIKGVVGWVNLRLPNVALQLDEFAAHPKFVGVRHNIQDEPDVDFMLRDEFKRGIGKLLAFGLTYDLLIFPWQLPAAIELVRAFPQQPFVLDHLAKPQIRARILSPWREHIRELAKSRNVMCKLSGLTTQAQWNGWQPDDFRIYIDIVFEAFGPDRIMFGSDWPIARLAGSFEQTFNLVHDYVKHSGPGVADKVFGLNAARFYDL